MHNKKMKLDILDKLASDSEKIAFKGRYERHKKKKEKKGGANKESC